MVNGQKPIVTGSFLYDTDGMTTAAGATDPDVDKLSWRSYDATKTVSQR